MRRRYLIVLTTLLFLGGISLMPTPVSGATGTAGDFGGRTELMIGQAFNGALIGAAFNMGLSGGDSFSFLGPLPGAITGSAVSIYSCYVLTYDKASMVTTAQAQLINSASAWGAIHGYFLGNMLFDNNYSLLMSSLLDASMTITATHYAYDSPPESSRIALINSSGMWGTVFFLEFYYLFFDNTGKETRSLFLLTGGITGMILAALWNRNNEYTRGEVAVNDLWGLLGALTGAGVTALPMLCNINFSFKWVLAGTLVGSVVALVLAYRSGGTALANSTGAKKSYSAGVRSEAIHYLRLPMRAQW
ncbi:MAG: hypothetical protein GY754_40405 [bacterium]|nr:hypothetical protein [bacterium]